MTSDALLKDRLQHLCRWIGNCPPILRLRTGFPVNISGFMKVKDGGALLLAN